MNVKPALGETAPVKKHCETHCDFVPHISVLGDLCKEYFTKMSPLGAQEQKKAIITADYLDHR